jgi:hypothetical protein
MSEQQTAKKASTVTVACNIPMGLLLHLQESYVDHEQTQNGVRDVTRHRKVGEPVTIQGNAIMVATPGAPDKQIVGGYALTRNISADFWDKWIAQNKDAPYVKNGNIFAMPSRDAAESRAQEQKDLRSGLEPLNPETKMANGREVPADPRFPRAMSGVSAITTAVRE